MRHVARSTRRPDIFDQLALRLRELVRDEHVNNLSGVERFTVLSTAPLRIEHMDSDLILEEGDPDLTIGAWIRQYLLKYPLHTDDLVWCLREGQMWHLVDISDPGGQAAWP